MVTELINETNSNQKQSNSRAHTLTTLHGIHPASQIFRKVESSLNDPGYKNEKMNLKTRPLEAV